MKMIISVAIFLLLSSQGDALSSQELEAANYMKEHKEFLDDMKSWLADMSVKMKAEVDQTTKDLQEMPNNLKESGKEQLSMMYATSMAHVQTMSAPDHCIAAGQSKLQQLEKRNVQGFFSCKNLTTGAKDIVDMGLEIGKLTIQLLITADDVLNGFGECLSWNPIKFVYCTFMWVKDTFSDIYKSFKAVSEFNKNIANLIVDMKNQFEYCMHQGKTTALLHHVQVVNDVNTCSAK